MKKAFTLIEVNLAMLIMAGGILSIVGLYAFGFRESGQSREDVESAVLANAYIDPLVMTISATNLKWSAFKNVSSYPSSAGWGYFVDNYGVVKSNPNGASTLQQALDAYKSCANGGTFPSASAPGSQLKTALVVMHETDSPIVRIGFRATKTKGQLMAAPLYYTEVRFQGVNDEK